MNDLIIICIGIGLNAIGTLTYLIETIRGRVKPNRVTYFLWSFAPFIAFFAQSYQGVGVQSLLTLSVALLPMSIFVVSLMSKQAYWKLYPFDLFCGFLSILGLILWIITKTGNIAILFSIASDFLALLPTLIKSYKYPKTELGWPWLFASASGILTLTTIRQWNFEFYAFPLYYFLATIALYIIIEIQSRRTTKELVD